MGTVRFRSRFILFILSILFAFVLAGQAVSAQGESEFLRQATELAHKVQRETRIPSSVILAQAIQESGWGRKPIANANNYFGMKAFQQADGTINYGIIATGWTWANTSEWDGTQYVSARERFRTYNSMADSFADLGRLYSQNDRYAAAMQQVEEPRRFAQEIARAGFATAPDYANKLIGLMDKYNLYQYDLKTDAGEFVDQSDYLIVRPGQPFEIYFKLQNTGLNTWRSTDGYHLQSTHGPVMGATTRQEMADAIPPEQGVTWTLRMTAPQEPGRYRTVWQMAHDHKLFGPEMYIDVTVEPPPTVADQLGLVMALLLSGAALGSVSFILLRVRRRIKRQGTKLAIFPSKR